MVSQDEFIKAIGNPQTEDETQIAVGTWMAEQIGHVPSSITYLCLGHVHGLSFCAYADGSALLGLTIAKLDGSDVMIIPSADGIDNNTRVNNLARGMQAMCKGEDYEYAAMLRNLITLLGVDPLTFETG